MTCSCQTSTQTSNSNTACSCSSETITTISPKNIVPVSGTEASSNKYSIVSKTDYDANLAKWKQINTAASQSTAATATLRAEEVMVAMAQSLLEIIRSVVGDTFLGGTGSDLETFESDPTYANLSAALASRDALETFLLGDVFGGTYTSEIDASVVTTSQAANIANIARAIYPSFDSAYTFISAGDSSSIDPDTICASGTSNVYKFNTSNCNFCFEVIYN